MRILYFSFVELDTPNACRTHTLGIIKGFAHHGYHVDALIPRPLKKPAPIPNVSIIYLWPWRFSWIGSLWFKLLSGIVIFYLCIKNRYDFMYIRELEINPAPRWFSRLFRVPLYIEINDLLIPYFKSIGTNAAIIKRIERNQKSDLRWSAGLIVNSLPMRQWLINHYDIEPIKFHYVPNGADIPQKLPLSKEAARKFLNIPPECFCLGFLGNIYDRYDFDTLLQACRLCVQKIPKIFLLFVGDGPSKNELVRKTYALGFKNSVLFTGYIESELLGCYLPSMDVGLCLGDRKSTRLYGTSSTKIATYGIYRIPVIISASLEGCAEALRRSLFVVPPEDVKALANLIEQLFFNRKELNEKAELFNAFAEAEMTWNASAAKILQAYSTSNYKK